MGRKKRPAPRGKPSFNWRTFLKRVGKDLLKDIRIREDLPAEAIESGWLGYEGASEETIAALEKRLKKRLPPSYRSFLAVSNGWRNCGPFIYQLWPCSEVRCSVNVTRIGSTPTRIPRTAESRLGIPRDNRHPHQSR